MNSAPDLVTINDPLSPASEAYRSLRMNLQFAAEGRALRSLLVVSVDGHGDSATLAANLAVALAQVEQRVILVDGNLRAPTLHRTFGVPGDRGLTTMMVETTMLADQGEATTPPLVETAVPGLWLLPCGPLPDRPPDLLGSKRMDSVLEALRQRCDLVLLTAPPLLSVTDGAILATKVDGVLLAVTAGKTRRQDAQAAAQRLERIRAHLVGAVLTDAPSTASWPEMGRS